MRHHKLSLIYCTGAKGDAFCNYNTDRFMH